MIRYVDWSGLGGVVFWALVVGFSIVVGEALDQRRRRRRIQELRQRRLAQPGETSAAIRP